MTMFEWSPEQQTALVRIHNWKSSISSHQIFRLFGFAGTGKTTLTKEIARRSGGAVLYCAFTGKASLVMRQMGCTGAKTIHSAIYVPVSELIAEAKSLRLCMEMLRDASTVASGSVLAMNRWGTTDQPSLERKLMALRDRIEKQGPQWILRDRIDPEPDVIICDECSMVNEALALDLMSFGHKIIVIGDPFQLPPVKGPGFFIDAEPDAMLREVHRQAFDNPIIAMATTVRQDGAWALKLGKYGASSYASQVIAESTPILIEADQVLCGTHRTRQACNAMIREAHGYDPEPVPTRGEKIICCRNNKDLGLLNGSQWRVIDCQDKGTRYYKAKIAPWEGDGGEIEVIMHAEPFAGRVVLPEDRFDAEEFDWGYAITVHKAQGSQWPHVVLINDSWPGRDRFQDRWLYTGITRAQERVTIIKPRAAERPRPSARAEARRLAPADNFFTMKPKGLAHRR